MKIYVGMIAYNEEVFIEASLKSVYNHVDEIIVIDGSPWGPSKDNTVKIAKSVGSKVKVVSGTWKSEGTDHKCLQRTQYLERMEQNNNNWCILHDADEVWDNENLGRLISYLKNAKEQTKLFSYQWTHFFGDCWHIIKGGEWDIPRKVGAFRLVPGIRQLNHHRVGCGKQNFAQLKGQGHIILNDVMFYHYGHACKIEKAKFRSKFYFDRDSKCRQGYKDWNKYYKEVFLVNWPKRMVSPGVRVYDGKHPELIMPLIGTYWPKERSCM